MSDPASKAVFLSYASQDAEPARRICESLRAGGVEVWFDADGGLEHGDEWDAKIRRQIKECVLFIPLISANTQARHEGYFRLEWELAAQRAMSIASGVPYVLPVVIDDTREPDALVPDRFRMVQWTRLRGGEVPSDVQQRFLKLWSHRAGALKHATAQESAPPAHLASPASEAIGKPGAKNYALIAAALAVIVAGVGWWLLGGRSKPAPPPSASIAAAAPVKSSPPAAPRSEARQLADRAFALSVDKYDSTLDDYTLADSLMQRALTLDASDGEILARSAALQLMFRNRGFDYNPQRIAKGREQAERAVRLVPASAEAVYALSLAQRYTGNRDASIESMERVVAIDPNHARALLSLGSSRISQGKPEEGLALYARARQQPEWAPLADYFEFLRHFSRGEFAEAGRLVRSSFRAGPSANNAAGIALVHLAWDGDLETAARELAAIPNKLLNAPRIVCVTALVHLNRRKPEEALKVLDRLPDEFIQDAWSTGPKASLVGRAHALAGRDNAARLAWESGLAVIETRLKTAPGAVDYHHSRGMLLAWLGRTEDALQEARTVQELNRGAAPTWIISEATIYAALGRADLALPIIEKMLNERLNNGNWPITGTLLRQDPLWDKIRSEPKFEAMLAAHPPEKSEVK